MKSGLTKQCGGACALLVLAGAAHGQVSEKCLLEQIQRAADSVTVAELKQACAGRPVDTVTEAKLVQAPVVEERQKLEQSAEANPYAITPHRQNYLLLGTYSQERPRSEIFADGSADDARAKKVEAQFQISFKTPLVRDMFGLPLDWYAAYTGRSFWQLYNTGASSPFRTTDHEPESWLQYRTELPVLGMTLRGVALGIDHQSNGRAGAYSRSWNRVRGNFLFDYEKFAVAISPWWRIPEAAEDDDNPDIEKYMGNFEALMVYKSSNSNTFDLLLRNNLRYQRNRGAFRLGWSFPMLSHLRGYAQWYYGYGESLIDYNVKQNTIGVGIQLTDW